MVVRTTQPALRAVDRDLNAFGPSPLASGMASERCDACGTKVNIAGGIGSLWSFSHEPTGGMTLALEDDTEHFLCFACIDELPDHPTAADVAAIDRVAD